MEWEAMTWWLAKQKWKRKTHSVSKIRNCEPGLSFLYPSLWFFFYLYTYWLKKPGKVNEWECWVEVGVKKERRGPYDMSEMQYFDATQSQFTGVCVWREVRSGATWHLLVQCLCPIQDGPLSSFISISTVPQLQLKCALIPFSFIYF